MIYGIGINDVDEPTTTNVGGKLLVKPEYNLWKNMLKRTVKTDKRKTYAEVAVCTEWLRFSNFKAWYDENHMEGLALDKDLLVPGNKVYGPDTCAFVPKELNNLFLMASATRGEHPVGVYLDKRTGRYTSEVYSMGRKVSLGTFGSPVEAHRAWQSGKIAAIHERLDWYKRQTSYLPHVYEACLLRADTLEKDLELKIETKFL